MINSVSFSGNTTNINKPKKTSPTKKGAIIGAAVGAASFAARTFQVKDNLKNAYETLLNQGLLSKNKTTIAFGATVAIFAAFIVGLGSLIGAGIGKLVEHFKKPDTQPEVKDEKAIDKKAQLNKILFYNL